MKNLLLVVFFMATTHLWAEDKKVGENLGIQECEHIKQSSRSEESKTSSNIQQEESSDVSSSAAEA